MKIKYNYSKQSEKFFEKHEDVRDAFKCDIKRLVNNDHPELVNVKRLKGKYKTYYRIAISSYRILYIPIRDKIVVVNIVLAGSRGDVYKKLH